MAAIMVALNLLCVFFCLAFTLVNSQRLPTVFECSAIDVSNRFDCFPTPFITEDECTARGCCWVPSSEPVPLCFYPENYGGYQYIDISPTENGLIAYLNRTFPSPYPRDVNLLRMDVQYYSDSIIRVKISDPLKQRFEPPYPILAEPGNVIVPQYKININASQTGFQITRLSGNVVFDAIDVGGFIYADQFLQLSARTSGYLYGLGEHRANFVLESNWSSYTMHNHDVPPNENTNLYGSHPYYLSSDPSGTSYGVFLHSSNTMEVLLQPGAVTFRSLGGILDFYFFMGPDPIDVTQQYISLIGKPLLPPYWGLGFQLCRFVYGSLENVKKVWQRNRDAGIPFDVQWTDYDYMINHTDFTLDMNTYGGLPEFIEELHSVGMHYVPMLDPGFSGSEPPGTYPPLDLALDQNILIRDAMGDVLHGLVWNENTTVWPDFTNPQAHEFWSQLLTDFHETLPFDGLWIDMNEPSNLYSNGSLDGCLYDELEYPPYVPPVDGGFLSYMTVCMNARQAAGRSYDVHNLFGIAEAHATNKALRALDKRPFIISRSTFAGSGKYTGHWSGDNASTWHDLLKSVQGHRLVTFLPSPSPSASDALGHDNGPAVTVLSNLVRNKLIIYGPSPYNDQDPAVFDEETINSIKKALQVRYTLLPYLYTLMYEAHASGYTAVRPLFFEFPRDPKAYEVELAFLWGAGLYIIPVLEQGATQVSTYLPPGRWYDWYTGKETKSLGEDVTLDAPYDTIPLLIRGGSILPTQTAGSTTTASRKNGMVLIAAPDTKNFAVGTLYWDDGEVIDPVEDDVFGMVVFLLLDNTLTSVIDQWTTNDTPRVEAIKVLGSESVTNVIVNGVPSDFNVDSQKVLTISGLNISINIPITAKWT